MRKEEQYTTFFVGLALGFAFGVLLGLLRWRTEAVQTVECKAAVTEITRVRNTCLDSLMWERQRHREIEEFHSRKGAR